MPGYFFDLGNTPIIDPSGKFPVVYSDDPLLTAGSLVLIDFNHPKGYSPDDLTALPADGDPIPNIARTIAAELTGAAEAACDLSYSLTANSTQIVMERTIKGMLHGIVSKVTMTAGAIRSALFLPSAIEDYILANLAHDYYVSLWGAKTRLADNAAVTQAGVGSSSSSTNNFLNRFLDIDENKPASAAAERIGSRFSPGTSTLGQSYQSIGANAFTGSAPADETGFAPLINWGRVPGQTTIVNQFGSHAVGRAMLIDLTVAGATYEEIDARDKAMFDAAVATGGKYAGDTWSDPATTLA